MSKLQFEKITSSKKYIRELYNLLKKRNFKISHVDNITFEDHKKFVINHPYRNWYIIKIKDKYIGSVYLKYDNSIGINIIIKSTVKLIEEIINFIRSLKKPLSEKKSLRYKDFFINVPSNNQNLKQILLKLGYVKSQSTYIFKK